MSTYVPIQAITLSSAANEVNFTNIPQTFTDLVVVGFLQSSATTDVDTRCFVRVGNNTIDSGNNYSTTVLLGDGTTATSYRDSNRAQIDNIVLLPTAGDNEWGTFIWHFMNYSNTTTNKTVLHRAGQLNNTFSGSRGTGTSVALWRSTSAINQIRLLTGGGSPNNFSSGSQFTLYGVGSGSPKAFGGDRVVTDGTYWYHAFLSSGRFEPVQSLSCDVLVVAGGGGASALSGGGGAGGLLIHSAQSLSAQNYTVTVGAGGTATDNRNATGGNGANSQFGTLTASVGGGGGGGDQNAGTTLPGANGGSGGGGGRANVGGTGTSGQGSNGGNGIATANFGGGGGGGAGAVGANAVSNNGGNGGIGFFNSVTNAMGLATSTGELSSGNYYYAGGGGGGSNNGVNSTGGLGGGGNSTSSANAQATVGIAGDANTGGGGGGNNAVGTGQFGGNGGSGIVIVRYAV